MERIKANNERLRSNFGINVFSTSTTFLNEADPYFQVNKSLQEVVRDIYGENVQIMTREVFVQQVDSCLGELNYGKKLIIKPEDFGYIEVIIEYYIEKENQVIKLGEYKDIIKKYMIPDSMVKCLSMIEDAIGKEIDSDTISDNTWIESVDGDIICKKIDITRNTYSVKNISTDKLILEYDLRSHSNIIKGDLKNINPVIIDYFKDACIKQVTSKDREISAIMVSFFFDFIRKVMKCINIPESNGEMINDYKALLASLASIYDLTVFDLDELEEILRDLERERLGLGEREKNYRERSKKEVAMNDYEEFYYRYIDFIEEYQELFDNVPNIDLEQLKESFIDLKCYARVSTHSNKKMLQTMYLSNQLIELWIKQRFLNKEKEKIK